MSPPQEALPDSPIQTNFPINLSLHSFMQLQLTLMTFLDECPSLPTPVCELSGGWGHQTGLGHCQVLGALHQAWLTVGAQNQLLNE